tara:strand:- start:2451 stop:2591 length:141 start_codon:yes stop_codon:yes gene_type:complete
MKNKEEEDKIKKAKDKIAFLNKKENVKKREEDKQKKIQSRKNINNI